MNRLARTVGVALAVVLLTAQAPASNAPKDSKPVFQPISELYERYDEEFQVLLAEAQREMGKEILTYAPIAPGVLAKRIRIAGTHRDLGRLTGLLARKHGAEMFRTAPGNQAMNRRIREMYREVYPPYLEKVAGVAEAFGMTLDEIDLIYLEGYFDHLFWKSLFRYYEFESRAAFAQPGTYCSLASYLVPGERRHLAGRNLDVLSDQPHFLVESSLEGVYRTIGHAQYSVHQLIPEGINEAGLFIGSAGVEFPEIYRTYVEDWRVRLYPDEPAVQYIHLHRLVLDTCATVSCALDLIGKVRVWFPFEWSHVLIADASGDSAVVEWDRNKRMTAFSRQGPFVAMTNTTLANGPDYAYAADGRYRTAVNRLRQGVADLGDLTGVMRAVQQRSGARTIYTLMADLSEREVTTYYGSEDFRTPHVFGFSGASPTPVLSEGGVVNAASYNEGVAAGQIVSAFGANLADSAYAAESLPLPTSLGGASVTLDGRPAPLFYVSPSQINFQAPWELAGRASAELRISVDGVSSAPMTIPLSNHAPGIFAGAIVGQDGSLVTADRPAAPGDPVSLYCTGLGAVAEAPPPTGEAAGRPAAALAEAKVRVGGIAAATTYAGLAPGLVGACQVSFRVPEAEGGLLPLEIEVGGVRSNVIEIAVGSR